MSRGRGGQVFQRFSCSPPLFVQGPKVRLFHSSTSLDTALVCLAKEDSVASYRVPATGKGDLEEMVGKQLSHLKM